MPLYRFRQEQADSALWRIEEDEKTLSALLGGDVCPPLVTHTRKRREWLAGRILARTLAERSGLTYAGVDYDLQGKPCLRGHSGSISIAHSFPYVAVQRLHDCTAAVDIERPRAALHRVAPRVLAVPECVDAGYDTVKLCVYWCAKEALFKGWGRRGMVLSKDFQIAPFLLAKEGFLYGAIGRRHRTCVRLRYAVHARFVWVYASPFESL